MAQAGPRRAGRFRSWTLWVVVAELLPYSAPYPYYDLFTDPGYEGAHKYGFGVGDARDIARLKERPEQRDRKQISDLYDGGVVAFDQSVGVLMNKLEDLGILEDTIVVITSDHGENIYDNGNLLEHGDGFRGGELAHWIPMILYDPRPGSPTGMVQEPVSSLDLMPTLLRLLSLPVPSTAEGRDLLAQPRESGAGPRPIFAKTGLWRNGTGESLKGSSLEYPSVLSSLRADRLDGRRVRLQASNWRDVFRGLGEVIREGRWVLVFDEFPWMGAGRTRIVSELKLYWDRWSRNRELALFLCGSVASFMSRHVVHSKALHNRKTLELCLGPLTPRESGRFIAHRSVRERAQLFMCLGGVPKYLEQVNPRVSLEKNLNRLCFTENGFFVEEYESLFKEQFRSLKVYEALVESLSRSPASLSELSRRIGVARGGGLLGQAKNLVQAQFVAQYYPVSLDGRRCSRTSVFKISDPFLIFYFRYIHANRELIRNNRSENLFRAIAGPTLQQYYGCVFERLGETALGEIRSCLDLNLSEITAMGPYFQQPTRTGNGLQIDWLIVRRDGVWTLLEFKYTTVPVGKEVVHQVARKIERLRRPMNITVEPVLISASGATRSVQQSAFFSRILTLKDLVG